MGEVTRCMAVHLGCVRYAAQHGLAEVRGLYRGVGGAAAAAGIIIGTYFAFYSSAKNFLRRRSGMREGGPAVAPPHLYRLQAGFWPKNFSYAHSLSLHAPADHL